MSAVRPDDPARPDLSRVRLFRGLKTTDVDRIAALARSASFPAATVLTIQGQPGDVVYIILSGMIRVHMPPPEGGTGVLLALLGPGEIIGELSVVDGFGRSATSTTIERASLLWVDGESFVGLLEEIPRLAYNLAELLARRLRRSNDQRQARAALDVNGRVAFQLLGLADEFGEPVENGVLIPGRLTQADLAGLTGASRVRVNQVLARFRERAWISFDGTHGMTIREPTALRALCKDVFPG